jgi:O-antigen/teichoic acid export membrane protein
VISLSDKAGFLIVSNFIKYLIGFVMPMVLVRLLDQHDYGTYQQMVLIATAAIGIMTWGLPSSVYYFYHHVTRERIPALVAQTSFLLGISGAITAAAIFFASFSIADQFNNPSMASILKLYAFSIAFMIASEHYIPFMIAQNRYLLTLATEVGESVIRIFVLLAPLWLGYGLVGLVAGIVSYTALRFVVRTLRLLLAKDMHFAGWSKYRFPLDQLGYSVPIALASLVWLIGETFNKGLLAASFTPKDYAIYAVGALSIPLDSIFQASVGNVLRASLPPMVRDGNFAAVVSVLRESTRKLSIIVLPSFIFLFGHAHEFITVLFTMRYEESVRIFQLFVCVVPLHMLMLSPIPQVFGRPRIVLYITLGVTAVYVLLSYALLKTVGFFGPAIAAIAIQYISTSAFIVVVLRLTRTTLLRLFPVIHLSRVVFASLFGLLVAKRASDLMPSRLLDLVFAGAVFSVTFLLLAYLIGVFTPGDREMIRRWIAKIAPVRKI